MQNKTDWYVGSVKPLDKLGEQLIEWMKVEPTEENGYKENWLIVQFLSEKEVKEDWITTFREKSRIFNDCYELAEQIQKAKLIKMASEPSKNRNSTLLAMVYKNILGWKEVQETQLNVVDATPENLDKIMNDVLKNGKSLLDGKSEEDRGQRINSSSHEENS